MIYTAEFLQALPFDEVEEILRVKFALSKAPKYHPNPEDKQRLINKIIEFQSEFGDTITKQARELIVGDIFLSGGSDDKAGITYDTWNEIVSINKIAQNVSTITKKINESSSLFHDPTLSISLFTQDKYAITYKMLSMRINDEKWQVETSAETETKTSFGSELYIVKVG